MIKLFKKITTFFKNLFKRKLKDNRSTGFSGGSNKDVPNFGNKTVHEDIKPE